MIRRLIATTHGEPQDVLRLATLEDDPPPGPGQVKVAVHAVGLNFLDVSLCRGDYPVRPDPPMTPGVEAAGVVIEGDPAWIGRDVVVCPALPHGALGDTVTISSDLVVPRPSDVDVISAAALPVTYQTAWFALERARLRAGETVLVHAGAGGVGIATIQLAVARGARVIATAGSVEKRAVCLSHGAADVRPYDDFACSADVVIDPVGGDLLSRSLDCLAFEGRLVSVGMAAGAPPPVDPARLIARNADLIGLSWGSRYPWARPSEVRAAYDELFRRCAAGELRPPVTRVSSLEEAPSALADLAARRTTGKVVVRVSEEAS
ncbi:NADPH:quinone oxidoreductase family protein [Actinoplanes bogorensis]|uniref:NADPH:quinone oxidoreductase family protein n=1 Tax=Paractinoplanes bogorensis TaxID=1610840 RepID=A0ABS5YK61_9ACTN|nr:NADPH:quinone oxidoreductase family protein [Actinoplanes bogorensis]MBU2663802.1 NADPH:quinone oxidoreductase family protein [Actinoplanes bogorensis]